MAGERTDIAGLIERLERATEPDHRLFYDTARAVYPAAFPCGWILDPELAEWRFLTFDHLIGAKAWESAAMALVERMRPGWGWRAEKCPPTYLGPRGEPFWATCGPPGEQEAAHGYTPAIALLIALLRTLETEHAP